MTTATPITQDLSPTAFGARDPENLTRLHQAAWRYQLSRNVAIGDAIILAFTVTASVVLRFGFDFEPNTTDPSTLNYPAFGAAIAVSWWLFLAMFRTRDPRILGDGVVEYRRVGRATVIMFGSLAIVSVLLKWDMSRGFLAISFPLGLLGLLSTRKGWRLWLRRQRRTGKKISRALVVGSLPAAQRLAASFNGDLGSGMAVVGVLVPNAHQSLPRSMTMHGARIAISSDEDAMLEVLTDLTVDTVIVCDSQHLGPEGIRELTWQLEGVDVDLMVSPSLLDISAPRMFLGPVGKETFIHLEQPRYAEAASALKYVFDLSFSTLLFLAASPVLLAAAAAVRLTSPGPILFSQERVGRDGRQFKIVKFRTMHSGADHLLAGLLDEQGKPDAPLFKVDNDPRITRVGKILRRYSIDELPQLLNVIRGDMSLVGPRPQRDIEVQMYDHKAKRRLAVRPGMTGLWQVSGRSNLAWDEAVRLDLYYVENWSMTGDLIILWKTIRAVMAADGAY